MNKKVKIALIIITLIFFVGGVTFALYKKSLDVNNNKVVNNENNDINVNDENQIEELEQEENTIEEDEPPVQTNKEEQVNEPPQQSNKNNNTTNNKSQNNSNKKPTNNNNSSVTEKQKKEETTTPPVVKKEIWDELGITEYEYYNSPMVKGQKVTHKNRELCVSAGYELMETEDIQFGCTEVVSYSGDTLGYMLTIR